MGIVRHVFAGCLFRWFPSGLGARAGYAATGESMRRRSLGFAMAALAALWAAPAAAAGCALGARGETVRVAVGATGRFAMLHLPAGFARAPRPSSCCSTAAAAPGRPFSKTRSSLRPPIGTASSSSRRMPASRCRWALYGTYRASPPSPARCPPRRMPMTSHS